MNTPETNSIIRNAQTADHPPTRLAATLTVKCEKLERERDEAIKHWEEVREYGTDEINAAVDLRQKLAQALVELDNMQDQRDLAMKVISRLERERDEAREDLEEEMKFHHRTHSELVQTQCKLLDMEMKCDQLQDEIKRLKIILDLIKKDVS